MKNILKIIILLLIMGAVWYLASPLFIDEEVHEDAPVAVETEVKTNLEEQIPDPEMREKHDKMMEEVGEGKEMKEEAPEVVTVPAPTLSGSFAAVAHKGTGIARLIPQGEMKYVLRLENLDVDNGPDLRVLLSPNADVRSSGDLGEYLELGKLKGNKGNQNYVVPDGTDVSQYKSAIIYCKPFKVVFNSANLK